MPAKSSTTRNEREKVPPKSMAVKSAVSILDSENVFIEDTLANKYKENPREMAREKRHQ